MDTKIPYASLATVNAGRFNRALDLLLNYLLDETYGVNANDRTAKSEVSDNSHAKGNDTTGSGVTSTSQSIVPKSLEPFKQCGRSVKAHKSGGGSSPAGTGRTSKASRSVRRSRRPPPDLSS
jgi:hypothetical protein